MPTILLYIAFFIVIIGAVVQQKNQPPSPTLTPTITPTSTPTVISATPTSTSSPSTIPVQKTYLQSFQYPGASVVSTTNSSIHLTSTDNADVITDWYKDTIKSTGFRSTAFAATKTNGNVLTKLAGSKNNIQVHVEITKKEFESTTQIKVTLDNN